MHSDRQFIADPTDHVLAVIDDHTRAERAERALADAGFEEVRLYLGHAGAEALDPHGTQHGTAEKVIRTVQQAAANKDNLADYATALDEGLAVISVIAPDERRGEALRLLEQAGAHTINYFGPAVVETLRP